MGREEEEGVKSGEEGGSGKEEREEEEEEEEGKGEEVRRRVAELEAKIEEACSAENFDLAGNNDHVFVQPVCTYRNSGNVRLLHVLTL